MPWATLPENCTLSTPALAGVTVITISNTLFFPCFTKPSSLSMFISHSFSCLTSPLAHFHPPTDSALWGEHKSRHPKCISWHSPAGAFPLSRTHAIWNTALVWALWQLLHHPSKVAGALKVYWDFAGQLLQQKASLILAKSPFQVSTRTFI